MAPLSHRRQFMQALALGAAAAWVPRGAAQPMPEAASAAGASGGALRYIVPPAHDRFGHYVVALLQRAAELTAQPYRFQALADRRMTQRRLELEVGSPQGTVDLMWGMTSAARRRELRRLDVKLDQGLIGWRVLVVRRNDLARWPRQLPLDELQRRRAGQGLHWPDVDILRRNGFQVDTAADTATLYDMLLHGRLDYFPRSVMEVTDELAGLLTHDVAIVPDLALRYDTGNYIFIGPHRAEVAADLEAALGRLQAQGELRKRFNAVFDAELRPLRLPQRRVIELDAPAP